MAIADRDLAVSSDRVTGTHTGALLGIPATGRRLDDPVAPMRSRDGRAVERSGIADSGAMPQRLGLLG